MKSFAEYLAELPTVDHIKQLDIIDADDKLIASIPNQDGKRGSLMLYNGLLAQYGALTPEAAETGLIWFAEHVNDAKENPGKHPNIDRLFEVIEHKHHYALKTQAQ